jgi:hypothetical protein
MPALFCGMSGPSVQILIARGRDATDVAITTTFGAHILKCFKVVTVEVENLQARLVA